MRPAKFLLFAALLNQNLGAVCSLMTESPVSKRKRFESITAGRRKANNGTHVLVIPGNPGLPGFYSDFVGHLHASLDCRVTCLGLMGHSSTPTSPVFKQYSLDEQIDFVRDFIASDLAQAAGEELVVVGHSIGAYIAFEALEKLSPSQIATGTRYFGLMPFYDANFSCPKYQRLHFILIYAWPLIYVIAFAAHIAKVLLPRSVCWAILSSHTQTWPCVLFAGVAATFYSQGNALISHPGHGPRHGRVHCHLNAPLGYDCKLFVPGPHGICSICTRAVPTRSVTDHIKPGGGEAVVFLGVRIRTFLQEQLCA